MEPLYNDLRAAALEYAKAINAYAATIAAEVIMICRLTPAARPCIGGVSPKGASVVPCLYCMTSLRQCEPEVMRSRLSSPNAPYGSMPIQCLRAMAGSNDSGAGCPCGAGGVKRSGWRLGDLRNSAKLCDIGESFRDMHVGLGISLL